MGRLEGKVAFITGAGSGIARASALRFAAEGAKVVIAEVVADTGRATEAAVRAAGGDGRFVQCDVTDPASVQAAVAEAVESFGGLDVVFNCAGGSLPDDGWVVDTDPEVWRRTLDLNLLGPMLCCRFTLPALINRGGGSIVNVSSITALRGGLAGDMYSATKGAIITLTRSLAARGAEHNVRANAIAPGTVLTERVAARMGMAPDDTVWSPPLVAFAGRHPFSVGRPEEIASIALFLASDESRLITGALIPAEGGQTAY